MRDAALVKSKLPFTSLLTLAVQAGTFIAFGGALYTVVVTGSELGYGPAQLLDGCAFSLGPEHSTANFFLVPQGMFAGAHVMLSDCARHTATVTAGNILGGGVGVALADRLAYPATR